MTGNKLCYAALIAVLGLTGAASAQDCKPAHQFETVTSGSLTVAVYEYPPYSIISSDGTITGVDNEIVKKIAAANCLAVVPLVVDPAATIQSVISGRSDLAVGDWNRTVARDQVLGLSFPIYLDQMGIYSKTGVTKIGDLAGKKVGTVSGFLWVAELQKLLGSDLSLYPNPVALAQDLAAGRVEIGVDAYGTGVFAQSKGGYAGLQIKVAEPDERVQASTRAAQSAVLYTKGNADLGKALDAGIQEMHRDGAIAELLKGYDLDPSGADVGEPRLVK